MDGSTVVSINSGTEMVQVDWDDGGTRNREVQFSQAKDDSGTSCMRGELN
jgi:hypothetical protein